MRLSGGRASQNKSPEAGGCTTCSRKSKDQCCWKSKVVKDEVRAEGQGKGTSGEPDQEETLRTLNFTPLLKP